MNLEVWGKLIQAVSPNVEDHLMKTLAKEVEIYSKNLHGLKCLLCPFRAFQRFSRLKKHVKYHSMKNMYLADIRSPQRAVVRALYDYFLSNGPISNSVIENLNLLQQSAVLIAKWNSMCSGTILNILKSQNRPILVKVLTHIGPQYWAKERTVTCIRFSRKLYYTPQFADLFLSLLLTNEARIKKCIDCLFLHFSNTALTSGLLPSYRPFWNSITTDITTHKQFLSKIRDLKYKAAMAGEFEIISHDETFKTLFCLIGQTKMSQKQGEFHALHTFRGFTGATIGVSAQRTTSSDCFMKAVKASFDEYLSSKVKFIFSDSPIRIWRAAKLVFPSLIALGEDPVHLPIRLEYCWGGKTTKASARVRQLHHKFRAFSSSTVRFWELDGVRLAVTPWPSNPQADNRTPAQWKAFCGCPFNEHDGYIEYAAELAKISIQFEDLMNSKNSDGVTALQILKNGASRKHYECLQNSSRLFARLGPKGARLGTGTARNEQLHRELKSWLRNIIMSHKDRLQNGYRIFILAKLLTHSSASYFPTLTQTSQSRLLSIMASKLRVHGFFPTPINHDLSTPLLTETRNDLHIHAVPYNTSSTITRVDKHKLQKVMWKKRKTTARIRIDKNTDVFKRPRLGYSKSPCS